MNTSPKSKPTSGPRALLTKSLKGIRKTLRRTRLMLLGSLMALMLVTSGCVSSSPLQEPQKVTVDASLMVKPNYTERLVKLLSE